MSAAVLTAEQRTSERTLGLIILLDVFALAGLFLFGYLAASMTLLADAVRGSFNLSLEIWAWITMRRIHRGRFAEYDYGTGKIERLVNVAIAFGLLAAALWIAFKALAPGGAEPASSGVFFVCAVLIADYNLVVNFWGVWRLIEANKGRASVILEAQIASRSVKALSSLVVFLAVLLSGVLPDPTVGGFIDAVGSLFVAVMMLRTAMDLLRESLPDLLDRSLADTSQAAIYRALTESFDDYDDILGVRTRRSGRQLLVELELAFDGAVSVAEVAALQQRLSQRVQATLPEAQVSLVPAVAAPVVPASEK